MHFAHLIQSGHGVRGGLESEAPGISWIWKNFARKAALSPPLSAKAENNRGVRYAILLTCLRSLCFGLAPDQVRAEWSLVTMAWNVKRMFALMAA